MEEWAPIQEFPGYEVSTHGRIRNENSGHILGQYPNGRGKIQVVMYKDGKNHARAVHKIVATTFGDPGPEGTVPIHIDGDETNNHIDNLQWKDLWFAMKLSRQRKRTLPKDPRPILQVETGIVYPNALVCANQLNGLEDLVLITAQNPNGATYLGSEFRFYRS